MTDTIDVAALVERLRDFQHTPHEGDPMVDMLLDMTAEAATALQSQADALAEARRHEAEANDLLRQSLDGSRSVKGQIAAALGCEPTVEAIIAAATTAEASLATMREALEPFAKWPGYRPNAVDSTKVWAVTVHSKEQDGLAMGHFRRARRALGGSNAE